MKINKMIDNLKKSELLEIGDKIIVGFSGGPDSIFLFELLKEYKKKVDPTLQIFLVHINHMLRGEDADYDENFSKKVAKEGDVPFFSKRVDILKLGAQLKKGAEEVGREVRYEFFSEIYNKVGGTKIALAHNKDDQVETFLFRLMRGTSLEGLEGIKKRREIYIRPILDYYKSDILKYLDLNRIEYTIDKSNYENEYTRNSIRLDLIPFLEKRYNPKVKEKICELMEEIRELNSSIKISLDDYFDKENKGLLVSKLQKESTFIQKRVINLFLNENNLKSDRYKIGSMIELLRKADNKRISIEKNVFLKKEYGFISIEKNEEKFIDKKNKTLETIEIKDGNKIEFGEYIIEVELEKNDNKSKNSNFNCFYTDLQEGDILKIRTRMDGDRFTPTGMKNYKKLKDFFINEKIPVNERDRIPLLIYNDEIVWVAGLRGDEKFKYSEKSHKKYKVLLKVRRKGIDVAK